MPTIQSNTYGKNRIRLTYVDRTCNPHEVRELSVSILFEGDFATAYTDGDNAGVLPTDTMKNTVYVLAKRLSWDSIEVLAEGLAQHFLKLLPQVSRVTVGIEQVPWRQIGTSCSAFSQTGHERRTVRIKTSRSESLLTAGLTGLQILKTANSSFSGFLQDEYTTLPETNDRLFGTVLEGKWRYTRDDVQFNETHTKVRTALLECFANHKSLSVQHTLFAMGKAVLDNIDVVASIHLVMPNKHCLLFDLARFGLENANEIFVPTDEPSGYIEARIVR